MYSFALIISIKEQNLLNCNISHFFLCILGNIKKHTFFNHIIFQENRWIVYPRIDDNCLIFNNVNNSKYYSNLQRKLLSTLKRSEFQRCKYGNSQNINLLIWHSMGYLWPFDDNIKDDNKPSSREIQLMKLIWI